MGNLAKPTEREVYSFSSKLGTCYQDKVKKLALGYSLLGGNDQFQRKNYPVLRGSWK